MRNAQLLQIGGGVRMIYVASPANNVTGGTETLHQLANLINRMGHEAKVYYLGSDNAEVPERFKKYNVKVANHIEDNAENILIIPEIYTYKLEGYKRIRVCVWWLSVDFYYNGSVSKVVKSRLKAHGIPYVFFPIAFMYLLLKGKIDFDRYKNYRNRYQFEEPERFFHAYNCEYAHSYIVGHGVPEEKTLYLCGPLNQIFFEKADQVCLTPEENAKNRQNIILFNPKKGRHFTGKIIEAAQRSGLNAEFIAIQNMTPDQIGDLMSKAKVYMDFGEFPGPERIPREAVTMGCNIITSRNGAAANDIDVPIPDELKFEDKKKYIPAIVDRLRDMLEHYERYYHFYDEYRRKVRDQVSLFGKNAEVLLEMIEKDGTGE